MLISKYKKFTIRYTAVLLYRLWTICSEVWGNPKYRKDECVQNQAARVFLGVHRFAPVEGLQGDLGWIICGTRRKLNMLRYWNRLISLDDGRLTTHVFNHDYTRSRNNWYRSVETF